MQTYVQQLKKILETRKIKLSEVSEKTGISYRTLQDNLSKNKGFSVENLLKICTFLRISMDSLFKADALHVAEDPPVYVVNHLSPEEQELLRRYRKLDKRRQQMTLETMAGYECLSEGTEGAEPAARGSVVQNFRRRWND